MTFHDLEVDDIFTRERGEVIMRKTSVFNYLIVSDGYEQYRMSPSEPVLISEESK